MEATFIGTHTRKEATEWAKATDTGRVIAAMAGQPAIALNGSLAAMTAP